VDHTIIMYLIDPEGNFVDYYLQTHNADAITASILIHKTKYEYQEKESVFSFLKPKSLTELAS
jgi:hypothetical protein